MKILALLLCSLAGAVTVRAQSVVDWFTMDAGGLPAASANYVINDTLGQADAATLTSANYTIVGGFWALSGLGPLTGLPVLHIAHGAPGNVFLWWPSPSAGFVLQENNDISNPAGWSNVAGLVADDGVMRSLTRPAPGVARFYRLRKP
jgi:hypothetical protein